MAETWVEHETLCGRCRACGGTCQWVDCPTGGWWAHLTHPADDHDADLPAAVEEMDDHGYWYRVSTSTDGEGDR